MNKRYKGKHTNHWVIGKQRTPKTAATMSCISLWDVNNKQKPLYFLYGGKCVMSYECIAFFSYTTLPNVPSTLLYFTCCRALFAN